MSRDVMQQALADRLRAAAPRMTHPHDRALFLEAAAALDAPAEPAAWQERQELSPGHFSEWYQTGWSSEKPQQIVQGGILYEYRPLYASPPAKRKPLTEEQISAIPCTDGDGSDWDALVRFARAIERAHDITED